MTQFLPQLREFFRHRHTARRFFRSRVIQSALLSSDQKPVIAQAPSLNDHYSCHHYYEPVRLPTHARRAVMHSRTRLRLGFPAWPGLPSSRLICRPALSPFTPEGSTNAPVRCFFVDGRLRPFWKLGRLHSHNEAESGSLSLRLAPLPSEASAAGSLPRQPLSRLLAERTICKVSTSHLTRSAKLAWRTRKNARQKNKELPDLFFIFLSHIFLSGLWSNEDSELCDGCVISLLGHRPVQRS